MEFSVHQLGKFSLMIRICFAVLIVLAVGIATIGISVDVALLDSQGNNERPVGAHVVIYRADADRNARSFHLKDAARQNRAVQEATAWRTNSAEMGAAGHEPVDDSTALSAERSYCSETAAAVSKFFGAAPVAVTRTDGQGRFAMTLRPGLYTIFVFGQAGVRKAVWLENVSVWVHPEMHLVQPYCVYQEPSLQGPQ